MKEHNFFTEAKNYAIATGSYEKLRVLELDLNTAKAIFEMDNNNAEYLIFIKKLPFEVLDYIARRSNKDIQCAIAQKYPLLRETYDYLATLDEDVRGRLAVNKKLPKDLIEKFRTDKSALVRKFVNAKFPTK